MVMNELPIVVSQLSGFANSAGGLMNPVMMWLILNSNSAHMHHLLGLKIAYLIACDNP